MLINKKWSNETIWQGCILSSIAHAIMMSQYPNLNFEQSWDGITYNVQDEISIRGSITFLDDYCVGCFRNEHSNRLNLEDFADFKNYFKNFPDYVFNTAKNEALQYVLDEIEGQVIPLITSAFWCNSDGMFSNDNENNLLNNGLKILEIQLSEYEKALSQLIEYYDMTEKQVALLQELFSYKIKSPSEEVIISKELLKLIEFDDLEGREQSRISFSELGFIFDC